MRLLAQRKLKITSQTLNIHVKNGNITLTMSKKLLLISQQNVVENITVFYIYFTYVTKIVTEVKVEFAKISS